MFKEQAKQNFPQIGLKSRINSVWLHIISVDRYRWKSEKEIYREKDEKLNSLEIEGNELDECYFVYNDIYACECIYL